MCRRRRGAGETGMTGLTGPALVLALQQWGNPTPEREGRLSGPREEWSRDLE